VGGDEVGDLLCGVHRVRDQLRVAVATEEVHDRPGGRDGPRGPGAPDVRRDVDAAEPPVERVVLVPAELLVAVQQR
jgi:hypothetical protein